MGLLAFACTGASRHRRVVAWCCAVMLIAALAACGGSEGTDTGAGQPISPAGQPGELPAELLLGEPRNVDHTSHLALAWSSTGAFTGSIVAQIEFGLSFAAGPAFTLQHNGAPAFYEAEDSVGAAAFELRYADGFFLLTAQRDNDVGVGLPFGVDLYPPDVPRVPPIAPPCTGNDTEVCSNSLGFINFMDWPQRAGEQATRLIPRADPAMLTYDVLLKPNASRDFVGVLLGTGGQGDQMPRGVARTLDFPTASVKVRGCNTAGECVESAERSLQAALVRGVIAIDAAGPAPNAQVALSGLGDRMAFKSQFRADPPMVLILQRAPEQGRWFNLALIENAAAGFARTLAFSADGSTLAVEASPCAVATVVCDASSVFVYVSGDFGATWTEQVRFDSVRAPQLSEDGNRLLAIGVGAQRGNTVAAFVRSGSAWRELPFPSLDYAPLDLALAARGLTLAVAHQGAPSNACGCRAVVIYDFSDSAGWHQTAVLQSGKRLDTVGSPNDDGFGFAGGTTHSLALCADGSLVAVGASLDSSDAGDSIGDPANHNAPNSGAIHVFQRQSDNTFVRQAFVKARGAAAFDHFGHTAALSTTGAILIGGARGLAGNAPGVNRNHAADQALPPAAPGASGVLAGAAAYEFERSGSVWVEGATMVAPNAAGADFGAFHGLAVSGDGGTIALATGAPGGVARRVFVY
ncbi:MAG TPA: hypothetical protein VFU71_13515 [Burkholderiaceae bacterium]|nr:hypothetical protein [Burkholderiaceae bacterium]